MIAIHVNGAERTVTPHSIEELRAEVLGPIPADHGISLLRINGKEFIAERWAELELGQIRDVELRSAPLREMARAAVAETDEWITRICGVLESVSEDYRMGREQQASGRLPQVADALHVLAHLLHGIRAHVELDEPQRRRLDAQWQAAEAELSSAVDAMASDLVWRDPIALADRTGYALPRTLHSFQGLLKELGA
jgi:hypothetical protein